MLLKKTDKIKMINEIHDSKLFYVREDCLKPVIEWLKETIENVPTIFKRRFNIDIPFKFPIEIKIGKNFGDMTVYK
jgi:DNA polymerase I-like protein with 3'-5' exonuclease and polymerase domains